MVQILLVDDNNDAGAKATFTFFSMCVLTTMYMTVKTDEAAKTSTKQQMMAGIPSIPETIEQTNSPQDLFEREEF